MPLANGPIDWKRIDLVVFDVDGTLYDQRAMRARMLVRIAGEVLRTRSLDVPLTLARFRRCREELGSAPSGDFRRRQYEMTAISVGCAPEIVEELVEEWMQARPLPLLGACRIKGVRALFHALRFSGKLIGIFSDYPAEAKLSALALTADWIVSAGDPDVAQLKPNPAGLLKILQSSGTPPHRALFVGDRIDRDWEAAHRAGMRALIRSRRSYPDVDTFTSYTQPPFAELLSGTEKQASDAVDLARVS
jgi:phosphoglycolate phosphatase/putative hydrolase of the HAD superfamily